MSDVRFLNKPAFLAVCFAGWFCYFLIHRDDNIWQSAIRDSKPVESAARDLAYLESFADDYS